MKLPINIAVEITKRVEDTFYYQCVIMVPDREQSVTEYLVISDSFQKPSFERIVRDGLVELTDADLKQRVLLLLFELANEKLSNAGGIEIKWSTKDVSRLLSKNFAPKEFAFIRYVLVGFRPPQLFVPNQCVVRLD